MNNENKFGIERRRCLDRQVIGVETFYHPLHRVWNGQEVDVQTRSWRTGIHGEVLRTISGGYYVTCVCVIRDETESGSGTVRTEASRRSWKATGRRRREVIAYIVIIVVVDSSSALSGSSQQRQ